MCGLAGIFTTPGTVSGELPSQVERMIDPIAHRGPDDVGVWADEAAGVALGFRRLSIIDLSPLGHQPMCSASGRYTMVFNGEVYNFRELRATLEQDGARFRGRSDSEVILASFDRWGIRSAIPRFIGMFAIAVWDHEAHQLTLVRDRLGIKPLFVYHEPGLVTFGSELKALVAGPAFDRTLDREAVASFLRYLYVPAPRTIYHHAIKLAPGHLLTISDPAVPLPASIPYWSAREAAARGREDPFVGSPRDAVDEVERALADAVGARLVSDVPLGALLSGGVDSSTVVALMQASTSQPVKTFTIGFAETEYDEGPHARRVAEHLGTDHTDLVLTGKDALTIVPRLQDIFDEPFADPSQMPTFLVSQLARQHVTVALSGDGGDEVFGGYNRYVHGAGLLNRLGSVPRPLRSLVATGILRIPPSSWDRVHGLARSVVPGSESQRLAGEKVHKIGNVMRAGSEAEMYRSLMSAWQRPERLVAGTGGADVEGEQIMRGREPAELLERMMLADQVNYLPDDLLAKVDRASMAVSLEVRVPILDHRVVELSWRLPRELKVCGRVGKWVLREVLERYVPRAIIDRPKMGFSVPIDDWLRGPLRSWGEELISPDAVRRDDLLDPVPIQAAWSSFQRGRERAGLALWAVIMLQAWRARWAP